LDARGALERQSKGYSRYLNIYIDTDSSFSGSQRFKETADSPETMRGAQYAKGNAIGERRLKSLMTDTWPDISLSIQEPLLRSKGISTTPKTVAETKAYRCQQCQCLGRITRSFARYVQTFNGG
jgi:hypothetical protein